MITVSYFSAGVSSAVATKLAIEQVDRIVYTHIGDQHKDTLRFVRECQEWFGKPVEILESPFKSVDEVCRYCSFIRAPKTGAVCTKHLKRMVRKRFEYELGDTIRAVWGYDCDEADRAADMAERLPDHEHWFPLIERSISKEHAHQILAASGIKRPAMYDLGYNNNNCIGCVKGGMGYWNHIRIDFPDVFDSRAKLERDLGFSIIKGVFLDELNPKVGRHTKPVVEDCGILCEVMAL